jgi:hypothetical protein
MKITRILTAIIIEQGVKEIGEVLDNVSKGWALIRFIIGATNSEVNERGRTSTVGQGPDLSLTRKERKKERKKKKK